MDSMLCLGKKMKNEWLVKNKNKMSVNSKNNSPSPFYTPPTSSLNLPPSEAPFRRKYHTKLKGVKLLSKMVTPLLILTLVFLFVFKFHEQLFW